MYFTFACRGLFSSPEISVGARTESDNIVRNSPSFFDLPEVKETAGMFGLVWHSP
jgi:hypothetical protein